MLIEEAQVSKKTFGKKFVKRYFLLHKLSWDKDRLHSHTGRDSHLMHVTKDFKSIVISSHQDKWPTNSILHNWFTNHIPSINAQNISSTKLIPYNWPTNHIFLNWLTNHIPHNWAINHIPHSWPLDHISTYDPLSIYSMTDRQTLFPQLSYKPYSYNWPTDRIPLSWPTNYIPITDPLTLSSTINQHHHIFYNWPRDHILHNWPKNCISHNWPTYHTL